MSINSDVFGSFYLNDCEMAISAKHIQEVINAPEKFTEMPLAPPYLTGLLNLRGAIIPVINLKKLLRLTEGSAASEKKIAIVEQGANCVGFLFDKTGEIFRSRDDERNDFSSQTESNSVISGVFKKEQGQRLVQVLNIPQLFQLQGIPFQNEGNSAGNSQRLQKKRGLRKQCISFGVGPAKCALGIQDIKEILKIDKVHNTALSVNTCIGALNLRGITVPVIDFAALLGYRQPDTSEQSTNGDRRIIILKIEKEFFGLLVDSVDNIISYHLDDLKSFPIINNERAEMFFACISVSEQENILLLNHEKVLKNKEITEITHGHSKLFQADKEKKTDDQNQAGTRRTYITFYVEGLYAVRIDEVHEIIEYPSNLLHPPGLPEHCKGLLNHRGQIVTVIDVRSMYGRPPKEDRNSGKILIFKQNDSLLGLVVDSVEGIKTFSDNHKMKLPESIYKQSNGPAADAVEAVQINDPNEGNEVTLFVLSLISLATRFANQRQEAS